MLLLLASLSSPSLPPQTYPLTHGIIGVPLSQELQWPDKLRSLVPQDRALPDCNRTVLQILDLMGEGVCLRGVRRKG